MALSIAGSSLTSRAHGSAIYAADAEHAGCRRRRTGCVGLLRVVSGLRSELAERNVYREQLVEGIRQGGVPWSAGTESRGTNGGDRGRDLERLAIGGFLAPFAEEQSATRGALAGCAMIR